MRHWIRFVAAAGAAVFVPLRAERQRSDVEHALPKAPATAHGSMQATYGPSVAVILDSPKPTKGSSHFCSFRVSDKHAKTIKDVTYSVLDASGFLKEADSKDIAAKWKGPEGMHEGLAINFEKRKVLSRKGRMHVTLCYPETSPFFKCNEAYSVAPFEAPGTQAEALSAMYSKWMKGSHGSEPLTWDGTVEYHQGRPTGHFDKTGKEIYNQWIMLPLAPAAPQIGGVKIADKLHVTLFKIEGDFSDQGTLKEDIMKALKAVNFQDEVLIEGHTECKESTFRPPKNAAPLA